jgi:hypothetical protein
MQDEIYNEKYDAELNQTKIKDLEVIKADQDTKKQLYMPKLATVSVPAMSSRGPSNRDPVAEKEAELKKL